MAQQRNSWACNGKTTSGNYFWLNLHVDGKIELVYSKSLGNGKYDRSEHVSLSPSKVKELYNEIGKVLNKVPAKPTQTLQQVRAQQGQQAYAHWTIEEEEKLKFLYHSGFSVDEISKKLKRGKGGIESRLRKLGLLKP